MKKTVAELLASGRVDRLLELHRSRFGAATMTTPPPPAPAPTPPPAPAPTPTPTPPEGFVSQETVNATIAREKEAATRKAQEDLATALGCTVEEAKQIIADKRAADESKKSDTQKALDAANAAKADAERIRSEAAQDRHEVRLERALSNAGVDTSNPVLRSAGLAALSSLDVKQDTSDDALKAAIEKAKKDAPQLFTATPGGGGTHTDPGTQRVDPAAPTGEFGGKGAAEAERRWGKPEQQKTA